MDIPLVHNQSRYDASPHKKTCATETSSSSHPKSKWKNLWSRASHAAMSLFAYANVRPHLYRKSSPQRQRRRRDEKPVPFVSCSDDTSTDDGMACDGDASAERYDKTVSGTRAFATNEKYRRGRSSPFPMRRNHATRGVAGRFATMLSIEEHWSLPSQPQPFLRMTIASSRRDGFQNPRSMERFLAQRLASLLTKWIPYTSTTSVYDLDFAMCRDVFAHDIGRLVRKLDMVKGGAVHRKDCMVRTHERFRENVRRAHVTTSPPLAPPPPPSLRVLFQGEDSAMSQGMWCALLAYDLLQRVCTAHEPGNVCGRGSTFLCTLRDRWFAAAGDFSLDTMYNVHVTGVATCAASSPRMANRVDDSGYRIQLAVHRLRVMYTTCFSLANKLIFDEPMPVAYWSDDYCKTNDLIRVEFEICKCLNFRLLSCESDYPQKLCSVLS